jgi:hypothetical protein
MQSISAADTASETVIKRLDLLTLSQYVAGDLRTVEKIDLSNKSIEVLSLCVCVCM